MESLGVVKAVYRYPVKSMRGEALTALEVDESGAAGDRCWGLIDPQTGERIDGRREPNLLSWETWHEPWGELRFRTPDGEEVGCPKLAAALRRALGRPVRLVPLESGVDSYPLHLLTTGSVASLKAVAPGVDADPHRFRPNVLIETFPGTAPFPERQWVGRKVHVGGVTVEIAEETARCSVVSHAHGPVGADREVLKAVSHHAGGTFGVYASSIERGTIRVGQPVFFE